MTSDTHKDLDDCSHCRGTGRHNGMYGGPGHPPCGFCGGTGKDSASGHEFERLTASAPVDGDLREKIEKLKADYEGAARRQKAYGHDDCARYFEGANALSKVLALLPARTPAEGSVPDRECFWLIERKVSPPQYWSGLHGSGFTADPWRATRYKTEREAHDFWLRMADRERDECKVVEHMFLNKSDLTARTPETDADVGSIDDALRLFRDEQISMGRMMEIAHAWRGGKSFTLPESGPETGTDVVKHMVDRFLCWRLPKPWNPDGGISYQRPNYAHPPADHDWPVGTNLFDADQATAMVHFMLEGLPANLLRAPAVDAEGKH